MVKDLIRVKGPVGVVGPVCDDQRKPHAKGLDMTDLMERCVHILSM